MNDGFILCCDFFFKKIIVQRKTEYAINFAYYVNQEYVWKYSE